MSWFGEGSPNIAPRYADLEKKYSNSMNKYGISKAIADHVVYRLMLHFFWEGERIDVKAYYDYLAAFAQGDYYRSDWLLEEWISENQARRNFFAHYRPYAGAYNLFIAENISAGMCVHRIMNIDEALDLADTGIFDAYWDRSLGVANTKPFFFAPDPDLMGTDTVTLTMRATDMPFQPILATPYLRRYGTIEYGQTIGYLGLKRQEVRLDLARPEAKTLRDDIRPKLTVKKHINLTDSNRIILERRFDVEVA